MTFVLHTSPQVKADLLAHVRYLAEQRPDAAIRFYNAVNAAYDQLLLNPLLGELYHWSDGKNSDVRLWSIAGFSNYILFYRVGESRIVTLRLLHGSQNWQNALFDSIA